MFSIGDRIVYGSMGVCTVEDIRVPDIPGSTKICYVLRPHYVANSKVYAPVENNSVNMRLLLSPVEIETLIDSLPKLASFAEIEERQALHDICRDTIKSADCKALARMLKTLYEKRSRTLKQRKTVPSAEKEYYDMAEKVFHGEIAAALDIPFGEVKEYIDTRVEGHGIQTTAS